MKISRIFPCFLLVVILGIWVNAYGDSAVKNMDGEYLFAEAEDMVLTNDIRKVTETAASSRTAVELPARTIVEGNSSVMFTYRVNTPGQYRIWVRMKSPSGSAKLIYKLMEVDSFAEKNVSSSSSYKWINLGVRNLPSGVWEAFFNSTAKIYMDSVFITSNTNFTPAGKTPSGDPSYKTDFFSTNEVPAFPKPGVHPRLYVTREEIPELKEKLESEFFKDEYAKIIEKGNREINGLLPTEGSDYTNYSSYNGILLSRAFLYLIGDVDDAHATETIRQTKNFLGTVTFGENNSTYASRYMGDCMVTAACVYDWCYDLMTEADKQFIIRKLKEFALVTEVGYPAVKRSYVISHAAECLIYRDQFSVGIAVYDEDPTWYNSTASIVFSKLLPAKNFLSASGNDFSGNSYAQARNEGAMHTERMVKALGYEDSILNPDYKKLYYKFIYGRLPNGVWFKEGDDYAWDRYTPDNRSQLYGELFRYVGSRYNDPYILREGLLDRQWSGGSANIFDIISTDTDVGTADLTDLPMTHYTTYPMSSMTARTSWQNGLNAPTAMAYVNMREVTVGDHQHRDIGAFQFYYKGMLALDSGLYVYSDHHYNYHIRSVAHNVMLVEDPSETYESYTNDGGQRSVRNLGSIYNDLSTVENTIATGEGITAKDIYTFSGPDDYKPEFSYISGDIAPAYSDKIDAYRRSFAFINLDNEDCPAALVVYDNLKSSDASFTKKWLLHSEEEPAFEGNTTTVARTDNGQNGKLVNTTLFPENIKASIVGGEGKEFYVNGTNYPMEADPGVQADMGKWRIEISPSIETQENIFLNVMYATDADKTVTPPAVNKAEGDKYVLATVADKAVVFPKERNNIESEFQFTLPSGAHSLYQCLFTGLYEGKWQIKGKNTNIVCNSEIGSYCITAALKPGTYTVSPAESSLEVTPNSSVPSAKEDFGDFLIRRNNNLMYIPQPTYLIDGVPYIAVDGILTQFGAEITDSASDTITFNAKGKVVSLAVSSLEYTLGGKIRNLTYVPVVKNGRIYVAAEDMKSIFGWSSVSYNDFVRLLTIKG